MNEVEADIKQMFIVAYRYGVYDERQEPILGITDDYEEALSYAKETAKLVNNQQSWWFDHDSIFVKKIPLNKYLIDSKSFHGNIAGLGGYAPDTMSYKKKDLWKLDESGKKLVNIENKSKWEEWS